MKAGLETRIISNFLLFLDHSIQKFGDAYAARSSLFYPITSDLANLYAYSAPFQGFCNDTSITGANVLSGVYVNGTYTPVGSGGLTAINHYKGVVYFSSPLASNAVVSGNYSVKEFPVVLSDQPEWNLILNANAVDDNSKPPTTTGANYNDQPVPVVYVVIKGQENQPFGFQKIDDSRIDLRCVIITNNEFQNVGVASILKNTFESHMPMLTNLPFTQNGLNTGLAYNYGTNTRDDNYHPWIARSKVIDITQAGDYKNIRKCISMVDFTLSTVFVNR